MDFEEIEDLVRWNLSYDVSAEETLTEIGRLDLLEIFKPLCSSPASTQNDT
jgi:hypothetical protein